MFHQTRGPLCCMETHEPDGKGSSMGYVLLRGSPQVRTPSKRGDLIKFVIFNPDLPRRK